MFADVIVNISHSNVDRPFEYIIPGELEGKAVTGSQVLVPFGKSDRLIPGVIINTKEKSQYRAGILKSIASLVPKGVGIDNEMLTLADYIRTSYGGTLNQALKTVLPVKKSSQPVTVKYIALNVSKDEAGKALLRYSKDRRTVARARLLQALTEDETIPWTVVRDKLNISAPTLTALKKEGLVREIVSENLRDAVGNRGEKGYSIILNEGQQTTADDIYKRYAAGDKRPSLIRGVTGSGKTEVYIDLIDRFVREGKQAIVLIPEISLTYQTVIRFYKKFGDRVSVLNSKMTQAERYDQIIKAEKGLIDIMIGPRSALFTPFKNLGIVIIDEEHETTYKNENVPRYHAREVAVKRAELNGAIVVMGSATPSVESYKKAKEGEYALYRLDKRHGAAKLPDVEIVDLRSELQAGNRSMISGRLQSLIADRLEKKEQIMLFINRRGHSNFVSCRSCGKAIKCPHCDVSLKYHNNGTLVCHYCGYETRMVKTCPECGSRYIGTFGAGTQKIEEEINRLFPEAKTLRMDYDTTKEKNGHEKILSAFAQGEADMLIGTQMIVKGHDFANVTLVGIVAADLSLNSGDFKAEERTFQLLTQAAGRAGRANKGGSVVIQTYSPENYAVRLGAAQDYEEFYKLEMEYRKLLGYPPAVNMLEIMFTCGDKALLEKKTGLTSQLLDRNIRELAPDVRKIGPADAPVSKINDRYRKQIYLKSEKYDELIILKDKTEEFFNREENKDIQVVFDFSARGD